MRLAGKQKLQWEYKNFKGTKWTNINKKKAQRYLLNSYRVLLTRARQGMIIFIPPGNSEDETCLPEFYDPIYDYLINVGVPELSL